MTPVRRLVATVLVAVAASIALSAALPARALAAVSAPTLVTVLPTPEAIFVASQGIPGSSVTIDALTLPWGTVAGSTTVTTDVDGYAQGTVTVPLPTTYTISVKQTIAGVESTAALRTPVSTIGDNGAGDYVPIGPLRAYDSRTDPRGPWGPHSARNIAIAGRLGVPAQGLDSVAISVSAVGPSAASYLTVYPSDTTRPLATALNFSAWQTKTNLVKVPVGPDGAVTIYNFAGSTHVTVDIVGFYLGRGFLHAASYQSVRGVRAHDSRPAYGGTGPLVGGAIRDITVTGAAFGVPDTATAVEIQLEAINPAAEGYLTVWPTGSARPTVSQMLYLTSTTVTSSIASIGAGGQISIFSNVTTDVAVDICGYYDSRANGRFHSLTPTRLYDTRTHDLSPMTSWTRRAIQVSALFQPIYPSVVPAGATSVVFSATAVNNTKSTYLTFWPTGQKAPVIAMLLPSAPGQLNDNLVVSSLGAGPHPLTTGAITASNLLGSTDLVLDINGYFEGENPPVSDGEGITGRVTNQRGVPVSGAKVFVSPMTGAYPPFRPTTITDPSGLYVSDAPNVPHVVCVDATASGPVGYVGQCWNQQVWPTAERYTATSFLSVAPSAWVTANVTLVSGGRLRGVVRANALPIAGVYVIGLEHATGSVYSLTYSRPDGSFTLAGLPSSVALDLCFLPAPYSAGAWPWKCYPGTLSVGTSSELAGLDFNYAAAPARVTAPTSAPRPQEYYP